jgi:hypothetical protein
VLSPKALVPQCTQALASTLRPRRSPNTNPPSLVKGAVAVMARAFPQPPTCSPAGSWAGASTSLRADLALDALEQAIWQRGREGADLAGLIHHSGVQYLAIRYTERLADIGAVGSVGSVGDSYDNAAAESLTACSRPS